MAKSSRTTLKPSTVLTRDLLVVDNAPLRRRAFSEAQKIIQKIEKLEDKIRTFHSSDQKLFHQWMELTFRRHRADIEKKHSAYLELARFHNWVVATSFKLNIEMAEAYALMREEQLRWQRGTEEERRHIEKAREDREAYIRQKMQGQYNESYDYEDSDDIDPINGGIEGLEDLLSQLEEFVLNENAEALDTAEERIDRLTALSEDTLKNALEQKEASFMLFDVSLNWGQRHHDFSLFKRLWSLMNPQQKEFYSAVFLSVTETPIEDFLQNIGLSPQWSENSDQEDEEPSEFQFEDGPQTSSRKKSYESVDTKSETSAQEKVKQVFRKLMRKLHPDVHAAGTNEQPAWVRRMWSLVQKAYGENNASVLERLLKLTLIRMNVLDELTVGELAEARHWLKKDFENLQDEADGLKNSMAWGFSGRKSYDSLAKRIEKDFERELRAVTHQMEDLEQQHALLDALSRQPRRSRGYSRSQRGRRSRNRRRSEWDLSF